MGTGGCGARDRHVTRGRTKVAMKKLEHLESDADAFDSNSEEGEEDEDSQSEGYEEEEEEEEEMGEEWKSTTDSKRCKKRKGRAQKTAREQGGAREGQTATHGGNNAATDLPLSLNVQSKMWFDKSNFFTESQAKECLGDTSVLAELCKFATGHFILQMSPKKHGSTKDRITYWLQNCSNFDFVKGYQRISLVVLALLQHVAAMQVCGAKLKALCKQDQELEALLQRCEQLKGHRVLVTRKSRLKSDSSCFWLQSTNKASDIQYFKHLKNLQEAVKRLDSDAVAYDSHSAAEEEEEGEDNEVSEEKEEEGEGVGAKRNRRGTCKKGQAQKTEQGREEMRHDSIDLPISLNLTSKRYFDTKNSLTESQEKEHLGSTPVLANLCKFATGYFLLHMSSRKLHSDNRIVYWLQKCSNHDFVKGYNRIILVISALLQHVAAMQVCGAELEVLCKEDQELQALLQRCKQLKRHRVLVTTRSKFKSDGYCFWLHACNDASDIRYLENQKDLQEVVERLLPSQQQKREQRSHRIEVNPSCFSNAQVEALHDHLLHYNPAKSDYAEIVNEINLIGGRVACVMSVQNWFQTAQQKITPRTSREAGSHEERAQSTEESSKEGGEEEEEFNPEAFEASAQDVRLDSI